jgi:hypothetical protein
LGLAQPAAAALAVLSQCDSLPEKFPTFRNF